MDAQFPVCHKSDRLLAQGKQYKYDVHAGVFKIYRVFTDIA